VTLIKQKCADCDESFSSDTIVCPNDGSELKTVLVGSLAGTVLADRFELLEEIGKGGMGVIYKAIDRETSCTVAVKLLLNNARENEALRNRFTVEARAARSLNHPNIVKVLDHDFTKEGLPYMAMEWLAGEPLDKLIEESQLEIEQALKFVMQICDALGHAHRHSVVHRDIKPANIMIVESAGAQEAVLVDFGIAKIFTPPGKTSLHLTQTGQIFGSPLYMSPEQCMGQKIDARADIYSLGCVLYESITGSSPFSADNTLAVIFKHINEDPKSFASSRSEKALEKIVFKAMSKKPDDRFQTMTDMFRALETYIDSNRKNERDDETGSADEESEEHGEVEYSEEQYFQYYKEAAEAGDASAQLELALIFTAGEIVEKNDEVSFEWCLKAATQGHVDAMAKLGEMYELGRGVELDYDRAYFWYHRAALQDHPYCCRLIGTFIEFRKVQNGDFNTALKWYVRAATLEDIEAQKYLGYLYYMGEKVERDVEETIKWMTRAGNQGDSHAQFLMATICQDCEPPLLHEAERWFQLSAEQGHPDACRYLSALCEDAGREAEALHWMQQAAEVNDSEGLFWIGLWHKLGMFGLTANPKIANKYFLEAAKLGNSNAQYEYAEQLLSGDGVARNEKGALSWLKKAVRVKHPRATYRLALCYRDGIGTEKYEHGYNEFLRKAAELEESEAQYELGMMYLHDGFLKLARQWLIRAAESEHEGAVRALEKLGSEGN